MQCRDVVALSVARKFMAKYPAGATAVAVLSEADIETSVRRCNFYKTKAKNVAACTAAMLKLHGGTAPSSYASLVALPGVGPKIAHLVSLRCFRSHPVGGKPRGGAAAPLSTSMIPLRIACRADALGHVWDGRHRHRG